ncbi:MAG: hypothetical protein LBJ00_15675 [Planctomycetaceae bacterium]|nr:hypothetical protein [Planctomycetaceae bacterium]
MKRLFNGEAYRPYRRWYIRLKVYRLFCLRELVTKIPSRNSIGLIVIPKPTPAVGSP